MNNSSKGVTYKKNLHQIFDLKHMKYLRNLRCLKFWNKNFVQLRTSNHHQLI